jgi:hypothetical protein
MLHLPRLDSRQCRRHGLQQQQRCANLPGGGEAACGLPLPAFLQCGLPLPPTLHCAATVATVATVATHLTIPLALRSPGTPVLKAFASLFINTSTCTASLIDAANTAYTEYIKSRPGVDPATVSVTVTCADLAGTARRRHLSAGDVGIVLQVGFQYSGPKEVAAEAVQSTNDCCPPKDGCGKSEVCAAPSLAGIKITGGAGSTSDPAGV